MMLCNENDTHETEADDYDDTSSLSDSESTEGYDADDDERCIERDLSPPWRGMRRKRRRMADEPTCHTATTRHTLWSSGTTKQATVSHVTSAQFDALSSNRRWTPSLHHPATLVQPLAWKSSTATTASTTTANCEHDATLVHAALCKRQRLLEPYTTPLSLVSVQPSTMTAHCNAATCHVSSHCLPMEHALRLSTRAHVIVEAAPPHRILHTNAAFQRLVQGVSTHPVAQNVANNDAKDANANASVPVKNANHATVTARPSLSDRIHDTFGPCTTVTLFPVSASRDCTTPRHYLVEVSVPAVASSTARTPSPLFPMLKHKPALVVA